VNGVVLHQRHDHEAAAVRQRADLERDPRQRTEATGPGHHRDRQRGERRDPIRPPRARRDQLTHAAGQQHEHEIGADQRGGGATECDVREPPPPARVTTMGSPRPARA
jgi:hypothetical protein